MHKNLIGAKNLRTEQVDEDRDKIDMREKMSTSIQDLERMMAAPRENEHLEFKEAKNQYDTTKLYKYCIALANEGGGKFILGVSDKPPRQVVGTQAFLNLEDIRAKLVNYLKMRIEIEPITHPSGRVLVFHVPSRPAGTALHYEGAYLMRAGEELVPMTSDKLKRIFEEGKPDFLAQVARHKLTSDEVIQLLDTQSYFDMLKLPYPVNREGVIERFLSEKLMRREHELYLITNLGAILFAKDLREFEGLSRKAPRVIVYSGKSKLDTRSDKTGTKGYAVAFEGLIDYINSQLPANEIIEKAIRKTVKMFPEIAIRELVANALIHQDFNETGMSIMIEIYSDRVEIVNPGLPFIPLDRFIDEYQSRNERLADMMRRIGICEEKGSGIDKVIDGIEAYQLPAPDFRVGEKHTQVILFAAMAFEEMERKDKVRACYQHCCLRYVMNEKMTNKSLRERFNLSESKADQVSRIIHDALTEGKIKLDDPDNTSKRYAKYIPFWA